MGWVLEILLHQCVKHYSPLQNSEITVLLFYSVVHGVPQTEEPYLILPFQPISETKFMGMHPKYLHPILVTEISTSLW